ncbi:MAG TPA: TonB-dependent receptor [Gammaproteobacteria bacterium]|nr:TonB-dependent receptor [Gammaproteobacteria bacterium]
MSHSRGPGFVLASSIVLAGAGQLAQAQQQAPDNRSLEEITVTGSRIRQSGFESSQPLSVIDSQQIQNLGLVNVGDVMRTLPQNTAFFTETNVGIGNFNVGAQLANLRGLNPFFGTRTLTLVDTKRVVPNTEGGAIDLTLIPSMLVARTEVVTGGASAAYGSDAIAGVVNVILDTQLDGIRAQADYSETTEGDGGDRHAAFAYGHGFADDRIHFVAGAEYQHQDAIGPCSQNRDWCREAWAVGTNTAFNTPPGVGNGLPNFVVAPNAKIPTSENGVISPCLTAVCAAPPGQPPPLGPPLTFNADGTALSPFDPGRFGGAFSRIGGDGNLLGYDISNIRPDIERYSLLGHVDWNLGDSLKLSFELANAHSESENFPANGAIGPLGVRIFPDNAFLTPAVSAALGPFGGSASRVFAPDVVSARNTTEADTLRFVTSVSGDLTDKWNWDGYYEHGRSTYHQRLFHNVVGSVIPAPTLYNFFGWAIDAVHTNPADPTSPIVCRATLPGPAFNPLAAGCVPLNYFGVGNADPAAIDYAFRTLKEDNEYQQDVIGANFRADLAQGWAGPIAGAFGLEVRRDQSDATHDLANQPWYNDYFLDWGFDRGGKIDVTEVYGEVQVPIVKKLQSDWSLRETRHEATSDAPGSDTKSHDFSSWKAALIYDPLDWLRFRGTRSQDVRAAGFRELFLPRVEVIGTPGGFPGAINNPWNNNAPEAYLSISGGNPDLKPETADTTTFGTVLSFDRFQFSVDWYEIDISDAITPGGLGGLGAQQVVNACFAGGQAACNAVGGFGTADITSVDSSSINIGEFLTRGYDLEARYNLPLGGGGNLNTRVIASYLYDLIVDTGLGNPPVNYHGQTGPVASFGGFNTSPDWQATAWVTYSRSRFTSTFETRYIGSGTLNATWFDSPPGDPTNLLPFSVTDNNVDSRIYLGWSGSYDFKKQGEGSQIQVFWSINNLLDKDPPVAPGGNFYPTNPVFFDTIGRRYRAGVRLTF